MKKERKIYVLILIVLLFVIIIFTINTKKQKDEKNIIETTKDSVQNNEIKEYVTIAEDGTRENKSSKIAEEKIVENFTISNISLTSDGKDTFLKADVKSTSKIKEDTKLEIDLLKEDGNAWLSFFVIVSKTNNDTIGKINTKISDCDFTNAYDLKITVK